MLEKKIQEFRSLSRRFHKGCLYLMSEWEKGNTPDKCQKTRKALGVIENNIEPNIAKLQAELKCLISDEEITSMFEEEKEAAEKETLF